MNPALQSSVVVDVSFAAVAIVALAAFVALDLLWRAEEGARWQRRAPWVGAAALAWGFGLWASHALSMAALELPFAAGHDGVMAFAALGGGTLASAAAWAWASGPARSRGRLWGAAVVLGLALVGTQAGALLSLGWRPGIHWRYGPLTALLLLVPAGCALALAVLYPLRRRWQRGSMRIWVLAAAGVLAATTAASQRAVLAAAQLPLQTGSLHADGLAPDTLAAVAAAMTAALLLALAVFAWQDTRLRALRDDREDEGAAHNLRDALTRLPTRQTFDGTLAQAVHKADQAQQSLALLVIGLDGFALLNESSGHRAGDGLLKEVARRLRGLAKPHMVARLGGDEFLLLLPDDPRPDQASALAGKVLEAIAQPCRVDDHELSTSCSVGIAMYPEHGALSTLIAHGSAAMRAAKADGGGTFCLFESRMARPAQGPSELLRDLRTALRNEQFELHYQPKVHAPSGQITGVEALLRWHHPKHGTVSPTVFIPLAERYGLIQAIGAWVIEEACRQARVWRDGGLRMRVAINLSVPQLRDADLAANIAEALARHQIHPELLTCEITESVAMEDTDEIVKALGALAAVGVHVSIDDFGSGYSSLAYLRKLPAKELKIDRGFVLDLETSAEARAVAAAVITLAKTLELSVVAEGVETEGQYQILRGLGCDQLQGYLFARPMTAKALALWAMNDLGPRSIQFRESLFVATRQAVVH